MNIKTKTCSLVIALIIVAIVITINPAVFAQSSLNQTDYNSTSTTSNSNVSNSSTSSGFGCSNSEETQLGAAIQSFLFRDNNGALMHMNEAAKTLTGAPKMHLDAAIIALQSGNTDSAKIRLQQSIYACGIPDIL